MAKHKHITRLNSGFNNGWQVRVSRRGIPYSKFFATRKHGGVRKALAAAIEYRDELLEEVGGVLDPRAGVRKQTHRYPRWIACWPDIATGRTKTRVFSVKKYGDAAAKRLAREARLRGIAGLRQTNEKQLASEKAKIRKIKKLVAA